MNAIRDDPAAYYVNVHTSLFPDGAVRGQLARVTVPETSTVPDGAGAPTVPVLPLVLLGAAAIVFGVGGSLAVARRRIR